ncbi:MAG TPA: haloacid dehalogenase-like hydrolase, partial [Ilumatobacteraceae bacterium]|nr:haloacid dehalogenase-like hydrolase [Ilumatobacteraceae bacterium]
KSQADMRAMAQSAAPQLVARLQPFAAKLFAEHRAAGRPIVLATTTPYDMVEPFADLLGFDGVVATRYGVNRKGLDELANLFTGKLQACRDWAERNGVSMDESYAYSDSIYDTPLLSAVAHPVAVNPDPRLMVFARARRWKVMHLDVPAGVAKVPVLGIELQQLGMSFAHPALIPYAKF